MCGGTVSALDRGVSLMQMRRVVITGIGAIAPSGIGIDEFWNSLIHGRSGIKKITQFDVSSYPCQVAGIVSDFDPLDYIDPKSANRLSRFAQFAYGSAQMAVEDSGIDFGRGNPYRMGVFVGSAIGGGDIIERQYNIFVEKGSRRISPYSVFSISAASASGIIGCEFNLKGPNMTIATGCNAGLDAIYYACSTLQLGDADVMIVSTGESPVTPLGQALFCATGFLSRNNGAPEKSIKPFDVNADGTALGEGGACIIVEELRHALNRGAKIYGEIIACSALNEAFDMIEVDSNNETMVANFKLALRKAGIRAQDIDYINAHGNGMVSYDRSETGAIKRAFGECAYDIPVTSIKPITGQSMSATGVLQIITALLVMKNSVIPPTTNLQTPAPGCDLNYVQHHYLEKEVRTALVNAHGFGGRITTLIVTAFAQGEFV